MNAFKLHHFPAILMAITFCILSACSSDSSLYIGSEDDTSPLGDIVFSYKQDAANPNVLLNRRNVSSYAEFDTSYGVIDFDDVAFALVQGTNTIEVTEADGTSSTQEFVFDNAGPVVTINSAVKNGTSIKVSGTATDPSGVEILKINEQIIDVNANGSFSADISESSNYLVLAEDKLYGYQSVDKYLPAGSSINPMIRATIDQSLIETFNPLIAAGINIAKEPEIFDVINPLANFALAPANIDVNLSALESQRDAEGNYLGTTSVALTVPQDGTGTIAAKIDMVKPIIGVTVNVTPTDGTDPFSMRMNIKADAIKINTANILLDTNEDEELNVQFVGKLPLDLVNTSVEVIDAGTLSVVLENPVTQFIVNFVTNSIEGILADVVPTIINGEIAKLLPGLFLGINIDDDPNILFKLGVSDFSTSGSALAVDLASQYQAKNPAVNEYALGIKTSVDDEALPLPNALGQVNTSISVDFINQAMLLAYQSGLLDFSIIGTQTVIGEPGTNTVVNDGDMRIQVLPSIPELHIVDDGTQVNAQIGLKNFELRVSNYNNDTWSSFLSVGVSVDLLAGFGFDAANKEIFLAPSKVAPAITVEQVTLLNFLPVPAGLINGIIDLVTPGLTDILSTVRLPLPIPADLPVQLKDISTVGVNNDHLSLSLDADLFALAELLIPPATSTVAQ